MSDFWLLPDDDGVHSLLEPQRPAYSNLTVRRAIIMWRHMGQKNDFEHVCKYYHRLEAYEENQLSAENRMKSRLRELSIMFSPPLEDEYLPYVYPYNNSNKIKENVFCIEGFHEMIIHKSITIKDMINTSEMIKAHCSSHYKCLKKVLDEFHDFTRKTVTVNSVMNISMFIKNQNIKDELVAWHNRPKHFSFLDHDKSPTFVDHAVYVNKNTNKTTIIINESRRKEMMNLSPTFLKYQ